MARQGSARDVAWRYRPILAGLALLAMAAPVVAQEGSGEIRGLALGLHAAEMPKTGFGEFACGSNGGPPREPLRGWSDFNKCRAEETGLHEVYVRFDDQQEYIAKALDDASLSKRAAGTRIAGFPVILSVLFDESGTVQGIRIVTDPRAPLQDRRVGQLLRLRIMTHYGEEGWVCTDLPADPGETPVGRIFVKTRCEKAMAGKRLVLQARLLRKPGQSDYDPVTGDYMPGQFESTTRLDILAGSAKPD